MSLRYGDVSCLSIYSSHACENKITPSLTHIALELDEGRGLAGHNIKRQTGPKKVFRLSFMLKGGERKLFTTTVPCLVTPKISIPKHDGGIPHKAKKRGQYHRTIYTPLSFFFGVARPFQENLNSADLGSQFLLRNGGHTQR